MNPKLNCVMLIDDDRSTNFLNEMVIRETNCAANIIQVGSVQEALEYFPGSESGNQLFPELIFLDINMPGMDGWEFLAAFRGLNLPESYTPCVVMLSSSLNPEDEGRAKKIEEICDYRHKPITPEMIYDILDQHF